MQVRVYVNSEEVGVSARIGSGVEVDFARGLSVAVGMGEWMCGWGGVWMVGDRSRSVMCAACEG